VPAIQPARLKKQAALLGEYLDDPPALVRELHSLLDFYADRAIRPGQAATNRPLTATYKVRPPLLRQIARELEAPLQNNPQQGLVVCDALWEQNYLEFRLLAGMLIGVLPATVSKEVIQRIESWAQPDLENQLMTALFDNGLKRLKLEQPQSTVKLVKDFLISPQLFHQQVGLRALMPVLNDTGFENLPAFFRILQPFVLKINSNLRPDLLEVIAVLAQRSPRETAYFLRESMSFPEHPDTAWIIRHSLEHFPPELQTSLRKHLHEHARRSKEN
jgi:hypothetical protein